MTTMQNVNSQKQTPSIMNAVADWEAIEPTDVPMSMISTLPELQPRKSSLIKKPIGRLEQDAKLKNVVEDLKTALALDPGYHAREPILVVSTSDGLFIADGHHRYLAYKKARRTMIPAKVMCTNLATAIAVSGMANTRGSTVALHKDEVIEAVWRIVTQIRDYGRISAAKVSSKGFSCRGIPKMFNGQVSPDTVGRMMRGVTWLREEEEVTKADWPDWRGYCELRRSGLSELPERDDSAEIEDLFLKLVELTQPKSDYVIREACVKLLKSRHEAENLRLESQGSPTVPWAEVANGYLDNPFSATVGDEDDDGIY